MNAQLVLPGLGRHRLAIAAATVAMLWLLVPLSAIAQERGEGGVWNYNKSLAAMLPAYCRHDITGIQYSEAERNYWYSKLGPDFSRIHHYCRGLNATNNALFASKSTMERERGLGYAIKEYDFLLNFGTKDFILLPEILTKKGENLVRLRKYPEAVTVLERAIRLKEDYWPAYAALSDSFRDLGDIVHAREWINRGIAVAPDSRTLKERLAQLDGMKSKSSAPSDRKAAPAKDDGDKAQPESSGREAGK